MRFQNRAIKVSNDKASRLYNEGWQYISKDIWKQYFYNKQLKDRDSLNYNKSLNILKKI